MFNSKAMEDKIYYYRTQKGYTQEDLAKAAGFKQANISGLEIGKRRLFNIKKLSRIADALDVSLDELLSDSIEVFQKKNNSLYYLKIKKLLEDVENEKILAAFDNVLKSYLQNINKYFDSE